MKTFFILGLTFLSLSAFADKHEEGTFEELKPKMIERVDKHIAHLQEVKSCVSAATDKAQLKACRDKMKAHREEMKKEKKAKKDKKKK
ncbi:MAG TPA: hypothetical protein VNJ08_05100 [Bacteriovoracaceae bacterium]|nr:hypothetical protein [Bacteriovoracaceae bacterium]